MKKRRLKRSRRVWRKTKSRAARLFWWRKPPSHERKTVQVLSDRLEEEWHRGIRALQRRSDQPCELEGIHEAQVHLSKAKVAVHRLLDGPEIRPEASRQLLRELSEKTMTALTGQPDERVEGCRALCRALQSLLAAESELPSEPGGGASGVRIVVPADLLWFAKELLFPEERMLVVAGRRESSGIVFGSMFDVTGHSTAGHVRADPDRLSKALIAMERSGTHLAGWLHSHPGAGAGCTQPSTTDLRQHQSWVQDYSERLLSGIFVKDGWVRFWGRAIDAKTITVEIVGEGVRKESENVYRLQQD